MLYNCVKANLIVFINRGSNQNNSEQKMNGKKMADLGLLTIS
jgi:hypothetical protein